MMKNYRYENKMPQTNLSKCEGDISTNFPPESAKIKIRNKTEEIGKILEKEFYPRKKKVGE